jgi:tetratricopeptide (TPR) repeat protein
VTVPEIPEDISASMLDKQARARLRTLSKDNAEDVGRHLVMAGQLMDDDPELAYRYAQVALARGGRVDIVREAAAVTAYATGRYAEALREFRTVRRLNGSSEHLPLMADCERGLGRPARALAIAAEPEAAQLSAYAKAELGMVVAGARADLGDLEAAHMTLTGIRPTTEEQRDRIAMSRADLLEQLGKHDQAAELRARIPAPPEVEEPDEDVVVYDLVEEEPATTSGEAEPGQSTDGEVVETESGPAS